MNRIAGILHLDGSPVRQAELEQMLIAQSLPHGGEQSFRVKRNAALGCTSRQDAAQSGFAPSESLTVTFDGRIDNRKDLFAIRCAEQGDAGCSDAQLVLSAYRKWGLDCPEHLHGDFAFVVWDSSQQILLCARDRFGVKPFYYSLSRGSFLFASTPQALLASGRISAEPNADRIADFLISELEGIDKVSSFYEGILRLPAAHSLIARPEGISVQRYWELTPARAGFKCDGEYVEAFHELFTDAVRFSLDGIRIPGSMLSGGLDSSAIVGVGRGLLAVEGRSPLQTFAAISNEPGTNRETENILAVVGQGGLHAHLISETELAQYTDALVSNLEAEAEPFDCLMNLIRAVYLRAEAEGVRMMLDGIQGDVLFSISGHLPQLWRQGALRSILEETIQAGGLIAEYKLGRQMFFHSLQYACTPYAPEWFRGIRHPVRYANARRAAPYIRNTIIDPEFAARARLGERLATMDAHNPRLRSLDYTELHKRVLDQPFITTGLERYERVAASFGIETRHPFHDVRLVEFCVGLPWQLKTRKGWTKLILRKAMEPYLPQEVVWRRDKDSLMWEFNRLILKERRDNFYQVTQDEEAHLKPYVDMRKLHGFWQEYLTQGNETHAEQLWSGIALAFWLRRHRNMVASLQVHS
jgi:asparagine synthase (glutamine-hydrolysing)